MPFRFFFLKLALLLACKLQQLILQVLELPEGIQMALVFGCNFEELGPKVVNFLLHLEDVVGLLGYLQHQLALLPETEFLTDFLTDFLLSLPPIGLVGLAGLDQIVVHNRNGVR